MDQLKLGILGLSEGNGHPYSWSAIFNGYRKKFMKNCPFPAIPVYLSKQKFPKASIKEARVTHIWTQDKSISKNIALASKIDNIVSDYQELIGKVDGILLARDDARLHYKMSAPFLKAGLPIYIDKPLATTTRVAKKIYSLQQYEGQIFTCSPLTYAKEFQLSQKELAEIGKIKYIDACVTKDWEKYSIHIIEPVLKIIGARYKIIGIESSGKGDKKVITVDWSSGIKTTFVALGKSKSPWIIRIFGTNGFKRLVFKDTFFAFKKALRTFVNIILEKEMPPPKEFVLKTVKVIERGLDE